MTTFRAVCSCGESYEIRSADMKNHIATAACPKGCEGQVEFRFTMEDYSMVVRGINDYARRVEGFEVVKEPWPEKRTCGVPDCWNSARLHIRHSSYDPSGLAAYYGKAKVGGRITYCCPECAGLSRQELVWTTLGAREYHPLKRVSLGMLGDRGHDTSRLSWAAAYTGASPVDETNMRMWDFSQSRPPDRLWFHCGKNSNTDTEYYYYSYTWVTPYGEVCFKTGYDPRHSRDGSDFRIY